MAIFFNTEANAPLHVVSRNVTSDGVSPQPLGRLVGLLGYCGFTADIPVIVEMSSDLGKRPVCEHCIHELVRRERERKGK